LTFFVDRNELSEGWALFLLALLMTTLVPYQMAKFAVSAPNYKASEIVAIFFCLAIAGITVMSIFYLIFIGLSGNMRFLFIAPLVHAVSAIPGAISGGYAGAAPRDPARLGANPVEHLANDGAAGDQVAPRPPAAAQAS
jgi:hypothetical protein